MPTTTRKSTTKKTSAKKAPIKPIDLFIGEFPTGTMFCDKNRKEHNDYKKLALVFNEGDILWYVDEKTLPSKIRYKILQESRDMIRKMEVKYLSEINARKSKMDWYVHKGFLTPEEADSRRKYEQAWADIEYKKDRQRYLDYVSKREKAIHTYPEKRRR